MGTSDKINFQLWAVADAIRGKMDAADYQKYILPILFYRILSDRQVKAIEELFKTDSDLVEYRNKEITPEFLKTLPQEIQDAIEQEIVIRLGCYIEPENLYPSLMEAARLGSPANWSPAIFQDALDKVQNSSIGQDSENVYKELFNSLDTNSTALGSTLEARAETLGEIVMGIGKIDFGDSEADIIGDAYEYLISLFAESAGKKGGEFYTPQQVSKINAKILANETPNFESVYDPTCGSGSLLLRISHEAKEEEKDKLLLYGQELNATTTNLAKMNMVIRDVPIGNFDIRNGNTLTDDKFPGELFDVIAANPPYSAVWKHTDSVKRDPRFSTTSKLAPKDKADFAFVQHIVYHLAENGTATVVLPHGVLFRTGAEKVIRKNLIDNNLVHGVIGLPANLFYGTSIPTCILVLKKGRKKDEGIFLIDASQEFEKRKNQNYLSNDQVSKIVDTFAARENVDKYAHLADLSEIEKNDYSLNLTMYVDVREPEKIVDLSEVNVEKEKISETINELDDKVKSFLSELVPFDPDTMVLSEPDEVVSENHFENGTLF